jgi:hypothetical protein
MGLIKLLLPVWAYGITGGDRQSFSSIVGLLSKRRPNRIIISNQGWILYQAYYICSILYMHLLGDLGPIGLVLEPTHATPFEF